MITLFIFSAKSNFMKKKPDFHDSRQCSQEEEKRLKEDKIISPDLTGRPRLKLGKATFFYKTEKLMKKSVVHDWMKQDPLRLKATNFTD